MIKPPPLRLIRLDGAKSRTQAADFSGVPELIPTQLYNGA